MAARTGIIILLILSVSMSGCVEEDFCGEIATFDSNLPVGSDYVIGFLAGLPCPPNHPVAMATCWTVKSVAMTYDTTSEFCLGYEFAECAGVIDAEDQAESCENSENLAPDELKIAFIIADEGSFKVGDETDDLGDFNSTSYTIIDDFSNATWEFTVDEEGNIYHFF